MPRDMDSRGFTKLETPLFSPQNDAEIGMGGGNIGDLGLTFHRKYDMLAEFIGGCCKS